MRKIRTILLTFAALLCFAAAYRFASHGIVLHDNFCIGLACVAFGVGVILLAIAYWKSLLRGRTQ